MFMTKSVKAKKPEKSADSLSDTQKRQLELGKMLQSMFEMGYVNKRMTITMSFAKGVASGFGAVVGATLVLALVLWILSLFDQFPFVNAIREALESGSPTTTQIPK